MGRSNDSSKPNKKIILLELILCIAVFSGIIFMTMKLFDDRRFLESYCQELLDKDWKGAYAYLDTEEGNNQTFYETSIVRQIV